MAQKAKANTRKHLQRARRKRAEEQAEDRRKFRLSPRWRKHTQEMAKMLEGTSGEMLVPEGKPPWQL